MTMPAEVFTVMQSTSNGACPISRRCSTLRPSSPTSYLGPIAVTGEWRFAHAARRTLDYVLADLTNAEGGFYSARDSDSNGEHGTTEEGRILRLDAGSAPRIVGRRRRQGRGIDFRGNGRRQF